MKQEKDFIEVPFGARDSELGGFEYTIPQGFEAEIKDGKVIVIKTESEDEKIRKAIVWCIDTVVGELGINEPEGLSVSKLKSWLEKQGEQKPVECCADKLWTEFRKQVAYLMASSYNREYEYTKGYVEWVAQSLLGYAKNEIKQKPTDNIIGEEKPLLEKFKQAVYDCAWRKVTCKVEGESKEEYANRWAEQFLLIVRDWADDYIDFTVQQKLRKSYNKWKEDVIKENSPAWSEEDEKMLNDAIGAIDIADYYTYDYKQEIENWLKSLKERYTWKPSDEQIRRLEYFLKLWGKTEDIENTKVFETVKSLLNDLKKLKS